VSARRIADKGNSMAFGVGLIGCGFIGRFHARNIRDIARSGANQGPPDVRYHAVCDRHADRADAFAKVAGCELVTTDALEVIRAPAVDAVYICTETVEHVELVIAAAEAGKHVFCEKPLATNLADARRMYAAVAAAGVTHQVGLVLRYSPVFRVIEDLMHQDDLGALLAIQFRDDQFFPVRGHYASGWRGDVQRAGGGTLIEHSIHDIDLIVRLAGPIDHVRCRTRFISGHTGVEDTAIVTFEHAAGHSTQLSSIWHSMDDRQSTRRIEIFFERGYIATEHDYFGSVVHQGRTGDSVTLSADEVLARYMSLEGLDPVDYDLRSLGGLCDRAFIEAAIARRSARPNFADAVLAHEIVEACYRSAAERRDVSLAEIQSTP
jgi:myo-inositol 2-dehydrogenase / D-chiro-inositol 1-dehydrogenase